MNCATITSLPGTWTDADTGVEWAIEIITEYRLNAANEVVPYKTRYVLSDGTPIEPAPGDTVVYGTNKG